MKIHSMKMVMAAMLGLFILLGGCSSKTDETYQNSIQKGLDAVAENNFEKAEGLFEIALDTKKDDVRAKAYLNQVKMIVKANNLISQNKHEDAIKSLDKSIKVDEGSKVISSKSKEKIEELTALLENQKNYNTMLTDAKQLNEAGDYQASNEKLDALLKGDLTQFAAIKDESVKIKATNDEAIKQAEIAQVEKKAQAEKEAEAKAAAEKPSINGITAEEAKNLAKRLPSYSDLLANGDTFAEPKIYDGSWVINISRPNGLAEGSIIVDKNKTVSFMYPNGEVDEVTPY
jgi:tetratricopeptide (TPR) repeat protein